MMKKMVMPKISLLLNMTNFLKPMELMLIILLKLLNGKWKTMLSTQLEMYKDQILVIKDTLPNQDCIVF